jgi:predicted transcriptional regulator of viral defense system
MDRIKPRDMDLVRQLARFNKPFWSVADLEKVLGYGTRKSLLVTLHRLTTSGILERVCRGYYRVSTRPADEAALANVLYRPSYLSFESALARYGILSQIPYAMTFASTRRSKRMTIGGREAEFRQIKKDLFFGYKLEDGLYVAEPEKALLDELYMMKRGKAAVPLEELDVDRLSKGRLREFASRFPKKINETITEYLRRKKIERIMSMKGKLEFDMDSDEVRRRER